MSIAPFADRSAPPSLAVSARRYRRSLNVLEAAEQALQHRPCAGLELAVARAAEQVIARRIDVYARLSARGAPLPGPLTAALNRDEQLLELGRRPVLRRLMNDRNETTAPPHSPPRDH
jgi:hypothetical protein